MSYSVTLFCIPQRQGLSLNLELAVFSQAGRQQAPEVVPSLFPTALGVDSYAQIFLQLLRIQIQGFCYQIFSLPPKNEIVELKNIKVICSQDFMAEGKRIGVQRDSRAQGSQHQSSSTLLKLGSARVHCCLTGESSGGSWSTSRSSII